MDTKEAQRFWYLYEGEEKKMTKPPVPPTPWEQYSEVIDINNGISKLEDITRRSSCGNDNWRDKENATQHLERLKILRSDIIKRAKEQYEKENLIYAQLLKDYEITAAKEKAEAEERKRVQGHSILGLDLHDSTEII